MDQQDIVFPSFIPLMKGSPMGRPKTHKVELTDDEVKRIRSMLKRNGTSDTLAGRCRILLALDERHPPVLTHAACAKAYGLCMATVANTARHFALEGIESVLKLRRSPKSDQARRKLDGRTEALLIATACGPAPEGRARWTLRLLEKELKVLLEEPISRETIRKALKKTS